MSRSSLAILAVFFALFAAMMWLSVGYPLADSFAIRRMYLAVGISFAALGAAAGALDPNRHSWGRRLLALIAGAILGLLAAFLPGMSKTGPDVWPVIGSLAIFFGFSLPLLMFALWSSIWGPLGRSDKPVLRVSASALLLLRIRIVSTYLVALVYGLYAVYRLLKYFGMLV
jgi:hypothetical protein